MFVKSPRKKLKSYTTSAPSLTKIEQLTLIDKNKETTQAQKSYYNLSNNLRTDNTKVMPYRFNY